MTWGDVLILFLYANAFVVIGLLIYEERDPSTTLAWVLTLILFPGIGLLFFILFGRNWRIIGKRDRRRVEAERLGDETLVPHYERWASTAEAALVDCPRSHRRIQRAIEQQNGTRLLPCAVELFVEGADKFARLFVDIEEAADHVHLEYFIWESDELTGRLCHLLARKVAEGVEVRVLYDWVGSIGYGKSQLRQLERSGAQVHVDSANWSRLNYRNHRKIVVIDGRVGYTGGMNLGQEYIDGKPRYESWRDTHLRLEGPLTADLQRLFAQRWYRVVSENLFAERYFPQTDVPEGARTVWGQVAYSGPETELEAVRNAFLLAIGSAEEQVLVQSPYFVPDESILESLVTQSLGGVDVRFMMTGVPDKRIPWNAAFSYIDELHAAGTQMLQYDSGFFHPKTLSIDGELLVVGTTNFDIRSFMLHDELSVFFYDKTLAQSHDAVFTADEAHCHVVDDAILDALTKPERFRNAVARLASRLL